jgi:hypothetical protein
MKVIGIGVEVGDKNKSGLRKSSVNINAQSEVAERFGQQFQIAQDLPARGRSILNIMYSTHSSFARNNMNSIRIDPSLEECCRANQKDAIILGI